MKPTIALLAQLFVAYTIEIDTQLERRMPHRTGEDRDRPGARGPLLTSLAYWHNYLRHIPDDGVTARELARRSGDSARTMRSRLDELRRWGYVTLTAVPRDPGATRLTPTKHLEAAREHWPAVEPVVFDRWRERFGSAFDELSGLISDVPTDLPVGFPVLAWAPSTSVPTIEPTEHDQLSVRLARTILERARRFDADSDTEPSLSVLLDLLRVIPDDGIAVRDLPNAAGIGKETCAIQVSRSAKAALSTLETDAHGTKRIRLTDAGSRTVAGGMSRLRQLEASAQDDGELRSALGRIVNDDSAELFRDALRPGPDDWRGRPRYRSQTAARLADPLAALPWFPMVSHRGGYPDGD